MGNREAGEWSRTGSGFSVVERWRESLQESSFRTSLLFSLLFFAVVVYGLNLFFPYAEARTGIALHDPLLVRIPSVDVSWITFTILYSAVTLAVGRFLFHPSLFLEAALSYSLLLFFRILIIYLFPLEPPAGILPLKDPFLSLFAYGDRVITKDLFFSGHTATLLLFAYIERKGVWRFYLLGSALAVAALVLVQHVHYSVDVLFAPLFAVVAWHGARFFIPAPVRRKSSSE